MHRERRLRLFCHVRRFFPLANKRRICQYPVVARRPETERILSREGLLDFRRRLEMLSVSGIEGTYRTAYAECRLDDASRRNSTVGGSVEGASEVSEAVGTDNIPS